MADKKLEKALYGPSVTEVALGALLGLLVGVLVACVYLVFKPVAQVKEMPKEPSRSTVYYIPGSESSAKSKTWSAKYKEFAAGNTLNLAVTEDELNAWANTLSVPPPAPKPGAKPEDAKKPVTDGIFNPGKPNFRIVDGKLQIGAKCLLNWYGLTQEVTVLAVGSFTKSGGVFIYSPEKIFLGSCPVHLLPGVAGPLTGHLISKGKIPDEARAAWAKLDDVSIDAGALKLVAQ